MSKPSPRKEGYKKRKDQGKCYRCFAKEPVPGKRRCADCIEKQRDYNRFYMRKKK